MALLDGMVPAAALVVGKQVLPSLGAAHESNEEVDMQVAPWPQHDGQVEGLVPRAEEAEACCCCQVASTCSSSVEAIRAWWRSCADPQDSPGPGWPRLQL